MARPERVKLEKGTYKKASTFFRFIRPYKLAFTVGMVFLFLSSLTAMIFPYLMGQLIGKDSPATSSNPILNNLPNSSSILDLSVTSNLIIIMMIVFGAQAIFSFFRISKFS